LEKDRGTFETFSLSFSGTLVLLFAREFISILSGDKRDLALLFYRRDLINEFGLSTAVSTIV
jgi:hypothetical protein